MKLIMPEEKNSKSLDFYKNDTLEFQNIEELYTNCVYYNEIKKNLFPKNLTNPTRMNLGLFKQLISIPLSISQTYYEELEQKYFEEFQSGILGGKSRDFILDLKRELQEKCNHSEEYKKQVNQLSILLERLLIDSDCLKNKTSDLIRLLLYNPNELFVLEYVQNNYEIIKEILNKIIILPSHRVPDASFDGDDLSGRETVVINDYEYNRKSIIHFFNCLSDYLNRDNFYFEIFNFLFSNIELMDLLINGKREFNGFLLNQIIININQYDLNSFLESFPIDKIDKITHSNEILICNLSKILKRNINSEKAEQKSVAINHIFRKLDYRSNQESDFCFYYKILELKDKYYQDIVVDRELYEEYQDEFIWIMKRKFNITTAKYDNLLKNLFARCIKSDDFLIIYTFSEKKELITFYKDRELEIDVHLFHENYLFDYSVKEYHNIVNRLEAQVEDMEPDFCSILDSENMPMHTSALKLLVVFGYNRTIKLLNVYTLDQIDVLIESINLQTETGFDIWNKYINFIFKENHILNKDNEFLFKTYDIFSVYEKIYGYKVNIKMIKDALLQSKLDVPLLAYPIERYLNLINEKHCDIKCATLKNISLYLEYCHRYESSIPDISGSKNNYIYKTIDMQDAKAMFYSYEIDCCMTPAGKAFLALRHALLDKNGRLFGVFENDNIVALSWLWRNNGLLCFDNIEVKRKEINNLELSNILFDIYQEAAGRFLEISCEHEGKEEAIVAVTLGGNKDDMIMPWIDNLYEVPDEIKVDLKPRGCIDNLYLTDSQNKQYLMVGSIDKLSKVKDTNATYYRTRTTPVHFSSMNAYDLKKQIDIIRHKAKEKESDVGYLDGYITNDYYVAINSNFELEAIGYGEDIRRYKEMEIYFNLLKVDLVNYVKKEEMFVQKKEYLKSIKYEVLDFEAFTLEEKNLDNIIIDKNWYYHGTPLEYVYSILESKEIACKIRCFNRLNDKMLYNTGSNGTCHICVTKDTDNKVAFSSYVQEGISFVLDKKISVIEDAYIYKNFEKRENNFRKMNLSDEFQVKDKISFDKIIGISIPMINEHNLIYARLICEAMDLFDVDLPIIDIRHSKVIPKELIYKYTSEEKRQKVLVRNKSQ